MARLSVCFGRFDHQVARRTAMALVALLCILVTQNACNEATTAAKQGEVATLLRADSAYRGFVGDTAILIAGIWNGKNVDADSPNGEKILNATFKWTSSNPAVIALVNDDAATTQNPHFLAKSVGTTTISVTLDDPRISLAPGVSGSATVSARVGERPVSVRLLPHNSTIRVGETLAMHWEVQTASGQPTFTDPILASFRCLDQVIAADHNANVDPVSCGNGFTNTLNLKGLNPGTEKVAVFLARLNYVDTTIVTVLPAIVATRVTVSPTSVALVAGATRQLTATVFDQSNAVMNGAPVQWLPKDVTVATVNTSGLLKAESTNGADSAKVQITAKAAEGVEATVNATVYRAVANVVVSPNPKTLQVGSTHQFAYELKASNGNNIPLNATSVTWATGDQSIATINQAGLVTAVAVGRTTVRVTTAEGVAGVADLTVEAIPVSPVTRVVVTPAIITLKLTDAKCQFSAKAFDANGNEVVVPGFRWIIDDSTVGSVDATGLVTFKKAGTTAVRAFFGNASDAPGGFGTLTVTP